MYNSYLNPFYNQQNQPQYFAQQSNPPMERQPILYGKQVDSIDVVKATAIPMDGSINYFPLSDRSAIITKQIQIDGTSKITMYKPVEDDTTKETIKYATTDDIKALEKEIDSIKNKIDNKEGD